jgi:periplasmic protein TonB
MSSSRLFLGRLLSRSACLRFADRERFSKTKPRRTMIFQRTAISPLTPCRTSRVHSTPTPTRFSASPPSAVRTTWENRTHRGWTTVASFAAQAMGIGLLLLLPLICTQGPPSMKMLATTLSVPAPPPGPAPTQIVSRTERGPISNFRAGVLVEPPTIPDAIADVDDRGVPPADPAAINVLGSTGTGQTNGLMHSILGELARSVTPPKLVPVKPAVRVSRMMQGNLVHRVEPTYPPLARAARIQGPVLLQAIIGKQGTIESLRVVSGHPMLVQAAVAAVKQRRYRPYELNGEPVEVETQVTVNFVLSGGYPLRVTFPSSLRSSKEGRPP